MAHRRSGFARRTSNPQYSWATIGDVQGNNAVPGKILGASFITNAAPNTLVRLRGTVGAVGDWGAANESFLIRCGIIKVQADANTAGAGSVPGPGSDRGSEWIWTGQLYIGNGDDAQANPQAETQTLKIDSKAMRKFKIDDVMIFVHETLAAEQQDQAGTYNLTYAVDCLARFN